MLRGSCRLFVGGLLFFATGAVAGAQQLPDAPGQAFAAPATEAGGYSSSAIDADGQNAPAAQAAPQSNGEGVQTKRILGIIPNFRSVSADQKLPPLSPKDKFVEAAQDSFDYSSIFLPAAVAGYDDARKATPEFGHGGIAYGRYLWHTAADQTIENFTVEAIFPVLTHEDPRYYTKGRGGFVKRTGYALSRVMITRTDNDKETFNISEIAGAATGAAISNAYYPGPERTVGNTMETFGTSVGIDAVTFMFHEFWPDINKAFFHMKD